MVPCRGSDVVWKESAQNKTLKGTLVSRLHVGVCWETQSEVLSYLRLRRYNEKIIN